MIKPLLVLLLVAPVLLAPTSHATPPPALRFAVTVLSPAEASPASGATVNDRGDVAGFAGRADGTEHATVWPADAPALDLGTLGGQGTSSAVLWPVKNNHGVVVGISQTDKPDPNQEPWSCSFFLPARPGSACVGFLWKDGRMVPLPTLGGPNGFAAGVNNRDQAVGWAETGVPDATCTDGQVLGFRAVRWDDDGHRVTELPPLPGDPASAATAINDAGRAVGISGLCDQAVGRLTARSAVVWDHGSPRPLADLGGVAWNTPMSLNQRGDVVGFVNHSAADGTKFRPVAAWWSPDGELHPLRPPDGYTYGQALGINARRQIVGVAFTSDLSGCAAVLWEHDRPQLLQGLTGRHDVDLCVANDINDRGQIAGQGVDRASKMSIAFRADPVSDRA